MTDADDIIATFDLLGDWEQRYQFLVELGERLPSMPEGERVEGNRVKPCISQVYVRAYLAEDGCGQIQFHADCDTAIIKGVVALLVDLFSGKTPEQVLAIDVDQLFEQIRLAENLSPNRHVGVYAIVELMRAQVEELSGAASNAA